jgi:hypothetical protein
VPVIRALWIDLTVESRQNVRTIDAAQEQGMKASQTQWMPRVASTVLCLLAFTACGPSEKQLAARAEATRIECLDKICTGDVAPPRNELTDDLIKLNGQWYVGPKEYFSSVTSSGFYWPSKQPMFKGGSYPERGQGVADAVIEIFFTGRQRWPTPNVEKPWEEGTWAKEFARIEAEGLRMQRKAISPQLEVVSFIRADGRPYDTTYYVASLQKSIRGNEAPVASCRTDLLNPNARCTSGEFWQSDVYADFRFRAKHAPDWPAIHQEIIRILNLAKKVQP